MDSEPVNRPEVVAEVRLAFDRYEAALLENDTAALDSFFWQDSRTLRYGITEHGLGIDAIRRSRARIAPVHPARKLQGTLITTFGNDSASVCTEFTAPDTPLLGRQTQTWIRFGMDWKIVAAHVSLVDPAALRLYL